MVKFTGIVRKIDELMFLVVFTSVSNRDEVSYSKEYMSMKNLLFFHP